MSDITPEDITDAADRDALLAAADVLTRRYQPTTWTTWGLSVARAPRKIRKALTLLTREAYAKPQPAAPVSEEARQARDAAFGRFTDDKQQEP